MEELKKYTGKTAKDIIILGIFGVVFAAAAIVLFIKHSYILSILMGLCSIVLFIGTITSSSKDSKFYESIENSSNKDEILLDFKYAKSYADDDIRMGNKYVFTKKYPELICFDDIKRLQYFEHYDSDTGSTIPGIFIELNNGTKRTFCNLYGNNYDLQAQEIMNYIVLRNPNVEVKM